MEPKHPLKGIFIVDLRPGERVPGAFFLVRHKQLEPFRDRSKGEFLTLTLGDRTGQMLARVWEGAPELAETFAEGDVVKVAGDVEEYLGRAQIIVNKLRRAGEEEYDLSDFLPATEKNLDDLLAHVQAAVDSLQSPHLAALVRRFYDDPDFRARLAQAPAARRVHHAYLGGLLEHVLSLCRLAKLVIQNYTGIDQDLDPEGRFRLVNGEPTVNFGKNRGRLLRDISREEPGFLRWILKGDFSEPVKQIARKFLPQE